MSGDGERYHYVTPKGYALSGKIMLGAIMILFIVVVFIGILHLYAKWYLRRARARHSIRRHNRRRRRGTHNFVFHVGSNNSASYTTSTPRGLDPNVLKLIPEFVYSTKVNSNLNPIECAVCLSEFEDGETGRVLPKCNHSFHIGCIDMWFFSHSTCPLCRAPVEPGRVTENIRSEQGPINGPCEEHSESASVTIDVPMRTDSVDELGLSSPSSNGLRSPGSRLLALKRMLSMNKRGSEAGMSCWSGGTELDVERGATSGLTSELGHSDKGEKNMYSG